MSLSGQQQAYVDARGNTVLCACPGSGKTFAVAEKVKKHLQKWNKAHCGIAVLSFTNVAIDEIKTAVQKEHCISYPHYFGTVDSFIDEVFLRYACSLSSKPKRPYIAFEYIDGINPYWRKECFRNGCVQDIASFRWTIDSYTYRGQQLVDCPPNAKGGRPCDQYKQLLAKGGIFFQNDIPTLCYRILSKHPEIATAIAMRYPIIIIDEAQDTSREQMAFFDLLCGHGLTSLDLVGDPDQAIYEWRNATPDCFIAKTTTDGWQTLFLTENRRSSQKICNATSAFSKMLEGKGANTAVGDSKSCDQMPKLYLLADENAVSHVQELFLEDCMKLGLANKDIAILTRGRIHSEHTIKNVWKSNEIRLFAKASYEWKYGMRKRAFILCEEALYLMCIGDLEKGGLSIEQEVEKHIPYQEWKKAVLTILCGLKSADTILSEWVAELKKLLQSVSLPIECREGHTINSVIKIKSSDKEQPDFKTKPLRLFFQTKDTDSYVRSSIHGVKGETYDAVLLMATGLKGNTITRSLLCNGELDCEMMRTAYVAMTRPRKYLAVAMMKPKNMSTLNARFPQSSWEYEFV